MVPLGVLVFVAKRRARWSAGGSPQVLAEKAEKGKRQKTSLPAFFVNWSGAVSPLPYHKLPERDALRNNTLFLECRKLLMDNDMAIPSPSRWWFFERDPLRTFCVTLGACPNAPVTPRNRSSAWLRDCPPGRQTRHPALALTNCRKRLVWPSRSGVYPAQR
jgi:hypothetical protein